MKVDAQIEEECRRTISFLRGSSYPKIYCKKLSNQKPTRRIQLALQEEFLFIKGYFEFVLFFQKNLSKAKYSLSHQFLAPKVPVLRRNKAPTSVLIVIHFSAVMKTLVLGYLFKLLRFAITFTSSFPLRIMRRITPLSYFLHFFKPQVANFP